MAPAAPGSPGGQLRLAKDVLLETAAAVEMLDELGTAVQDTIQELRELAHGIYPPLLVDSGLAGHFASGHRSPLDVELSTEGIGRYDGDIEAAIYFCCLEALQNAGSTLRTRTSRYASGRSRRTAVSVTDDGPGFDVRAAQHGHGFVNMMDRLVPSAAVRWESERGRGTAIRGSGLSTDSWLGGKAIGVALFPEPAKDLGPNCSLCM